MAVTVSRWPSPAAQCRAVLPRRSLTAVSAPASHQSFDDFGVTAFGGKKQGAPLIHVLFIKVNAGVDQQPGIVQIALLGNGA